MLRDDETSCAIVDEESGTSELLPSLIKHHTSIAVKLKRLLIMWLTSVMLTPLLLYCIVTTVQSASIILLIDDNVTLYDNFTETLLLEDTALVEDDQNVTASSNSSLDTTSEIVTSISASASPSSFNSSSHPASRKASKTVGVLPVPMSSRGKSKSKIDCMIDAKKGFNNPTNVYQCHVTQKCCLEYAKPSCCGSKSTTQIM